MILYILMEQLGIDPNIETSDLVRLGKKNTGEQTRVRPLRFKVKDLESKNVILRAGKFLRNSADKSINSIFITPDLTKQQRDDAYKLRQEKKQRELEGEENLRIVRGKIIKDRPKTKPTRPAIGRTTRYKGYEPPKDLAKNQNDEVQDQHASFSDDGFGAGGTGGGVD